jgi:hypothetical protein
MFCDAVAAASTLTWRAQKASTQEMSATMLGWQQRLKRLKQLKGYECKLLIVDKEY